MFYTLIFILILTFLYQNAFYQTVFGIYQDNRCWSYISIDILKSAFYRIAVLKETLDFIGTPWELRAADTSLSFLVFSFQEIFPKDQQSACTLLDSSVCD